MGRRIFYLPKRPLRDAFLAQNTIQIRLRACRRPSILSPVKPLRHQTLETPFRRFNKVRDGTPRGPKGGQEEAKGTQRNPRATNGRGPNGTHGGQGEPRGAKGSPGAPSAPLGGNGPRAIWDYSEAISNGKQFRVEGYYEWEDILRRKLI